MRETAGLRILFVGWLGSGQTSLQRMHAFERLGHSVTGVDATAVAKAWALELLPRISGKLFRLGLNGFGPRDRSGANASVLALCRERDWDLLWIEKGVTIEADTLAEVRRLRPRCRIVGYSRDDMFARHNQSRPFLQSLPLYHVYFTTKSYGVQELKSLGAHEVHFVANSYDPFTHRPMTVGTADRQRLGGKVGFVGSCELERRRSMEFLAANGIPLRVWGPHWPSRSGLKHLTLERRCLWGDEYALAISAFDINLAFLRKINRDLHTGRSVEIPACGGFMLAERTEEHQELFEEGKEAEYFGPDTELLEKTRYYLVHEAERKRIATAGYDRCIRSGYSNEARLPRMVATALKGL